MSGLEASQRALALFDQLVDLPAREREQQLAALASSEPALHDRVRALLAADAVSGGVLEQDASRLFETAAESGPDPLLGQRVGPWRIEGVLGRGGMGAVYRGERVDGEFGQQAAIKLIRMGLDQPELRRRFLRERQILARLQHPNIATLLDGGVDERGAPYFAMELVDGLPIDRWCDDQRLDLRARVALFVQVCGAVQHAHRSLAVHRDLKPSNILVTPAGQAKLLDFGIAKLLEQDEGETQTRDRLLTPDFAAPEQLRGEPVTTATDIYSLGVVLYGLLAGSHPFPTPSGSVGPRRPVAFDVEAVPLSRAALRLPASEAVARRLTPVALARSLRGDLAAIVHRCLDGEPGRRYPTVEALAADLQAWLAGRPVSARPGHRGYRLRKFVARHRFGVAASALAAVAVVAALGVAVQQAREAREQARHAERTSEFVVSLFEEASPMRSERGSQLTAAELLDAAAQRVDQELVDSPDTQAQLRVAIGFSLRQLGESRAALPLIEAGVAQMRTQAVVPAAMASALHQLGMTREDLGEADAAETLIREGLALLDTEPGKHPLMTVQLRTTLARLLSQRGRPREALEQHLGIQRARAELVGADHPDTAVDWNNLGNAYVRLDQCAQAEHAFTEAMDRISRGLGAEHPRAVWVRAGLATARDCAGHYPQAEADFAETERLILKTLSPEHPLMVSLLGARGNSSFRQGDVAGSIVHFEQALALARKQESPAVPRLEGRLGISHLASGRPAQARELLVAALEKLPEAPGQATDPQRCRYEAALGLAMFLTGEREAGEATLRAALDKLETAGEADSEDYAESAADLAMLLGQRGDDAGSRQWLRQSADAYRRTFGADHPLSRRAAARIADAG